MPTISKSKKYLLAFRFLNLASVTAVASMLDPLLFHPALEKEDLDSSIIDFTLPSIVAKKAVME